MRALIVEDRASFAPLVCRSLRDLGIDCRSISHPRAVSILGDTWEQLDLVLLDALDLSSQQDDPRASRLTSLDVLDRLANSGGDRPVVVSYSTSMDRPEIHLPMWTHAAVDACFDAVSLLDHLGSIVEGRLDRGAQPAPTPATWHALEPDLPTCAQLAPAHQLIRRHERAWRQIWDSQAPFDKAAQVWITRNVLPLLGLSSSHGYGVARSTIRRIAGLPYRL